MELIENLLQLLTTFVGALLSGISYRKSGRQVYFLLLCFYGCFALGVALLDAVSAAVRYHAAGLLCVGVRLGGERNFPAHFAGDALHTGGTQPSAAAGRGLRLRSACRCWRFTAPSGTFSPT